MTKDVLSFEEKRLEKLPPRELGRYLMQLPVKQRFDLILQRADAEAVVAALAEQDFYYSLKEIGPDDGLPLLALARIDQINHILDLECWRKESILAAKGVEWLERLARASEEKLLAWLYQADFELLVSLFKNWLIVAVGPEDVDPVEATEYLPRHTLDDQYYWETRYPQYEDFLKMLLSLLFEVHYGFYKELMNSILYAVDSEAEEEAYRFHRARLEDLSIPDFYDALEIYRSVRPGEIVANKEQALRKPEDLSPPSFALALLPREDFLSRALRQVQDADLIDTLQFELAALANKVVVADQLPPDNPEGLQRAVDKVAAYVDLGLQMQTKGNLEASVRVLREMFLEHLFRIGQAEVAKLRGRMQQVVQRGWLSRWPAGLKCLEPDWMDATELLLGKTPKLLRPATSSGLTAGSPREDFFRSRQDLFRGKHIVDAIISLGPLFDALEVDHRRVSEGLWQQGQIRAIEDITLGILIWTAAARSQLSGKWEVLPLPVSGWPTLFPALKADVMENLIRSWVDRVLPEPGHRALAEAYLGPLFEAYSTEMIPFDAQNPPDSHMVRFFLFTRD
jgi:hypothetical protein